MRRLEAPVLTALAIVLISLAGASAASATILEVKGAAKNERVSFSASLKGSATLSSTSGVFANTCTASQLGGYTVTPYFGPAVSGQVSTLSYGSCTHENVFVFKMGTLSIRSNGGTNGTVSSTGAELTVPVTIFGFVASATCTTNETDLGTLTGAASGSATLHVNAILTCGEILPTAKLEATYTVTSPEGLGVTPTTTTLEVNGAAKNQAVLIRASSIGSVTLKSAAGLGTNTCSASTIEESTTAFSGTAVLGQVSLLSFSFCTHSNVVIDAKGTLSIERIPGTTNGTVRSTGAIITMPVTVGSSVVTATCTTNETDIGTLTGVATGHARLDVNAALNCGSSFLNSIWEATYEVTNLEGLGVTS
jgi:hypothetical protein